MQILLLIDYRTIVFLLLCLYRVESTSILQLSVIHVNDIHARFEETSKTSTRCVRDCIGGISRLYTAATKLALERPNSIFLNAGDTYQGTLWYNVHRWNVSQHFLNKFPADAYTLGNHEFDDDIDGVVQFMRALRSPIIVANMDAALEPRMQGLFSKSIVLVRNNTRIGIIGVIASNTDVIAKTGRLRFTNEIEAVNNEAKNLVKNENCKIIIVLSHCGYDIDKDMARQANPHISLIVGGHSHTFLYTGSDLPGPEKPEGPYPTVIRSKYGKKVLIVQASLNTKYLGNITVFYNEKGDVESWEGKPIYLDKSIPQDPDINEDLKEWKKSVDAYGHTVLGTSNVLLDRTDRRTGESNIGSFLTDAMVDSYVSKAPNGSWTYAAIAVINSGSIRSSIDPGDVTLYDLIAAQPFENTVDCIELTGQQIKDLLEYSVTTSSFRQFIYHEFLQVSGIRVVFNLNNAENNRVVQLKLRCNECITPKYYNVNYTQYYRIIIPSYLADGGDGYKIIKDNMKLRMIGDKDINIYSRYIKKLSPVTQSYDDRIIIEGDSEYNRSAPIISNMFSRLTAYALIALYCIQIILI